MQAAEREVSYPPTFAEPTARRSRKKKLSEAELQVLSDRRLPAVLLLPEHGLLASASSYVRGEP